MAIDRGQPGGAPLASLDSLEVPAPKRIYTFGGLLGLVLYEMMYHRWAQHGHMRVERRVRNMFSVTGLGKPMGSGLCNPTQAYIYGGRHLWTTLTRPGTSAAIPGRRMPLRRRPRHRRAFSALAWWRC